MTRTQILELAMVLTERKGEKVLDYQSLYRFVLQDICKRQRFWWRRISLSFSLVINQKTYDLTNATLFPTLTEISFDEITKITVITAPNPLLKTELVAVFDPETLVEMQQNTSSVSPGRYTMTDDHTILMDPPNAAYLTYLVGWAMPNPADESTNDAVPLIPTWGHNTIVAGMNAKIFKFAYGSKNEKTLDARMEYEQGLQDLMSKKQFDPNYRSQLSLNESAVRST